MRYRREIPHKSSINLKHLKQHERKAGKKHVCFHSTENIKYESGNKDCEVKYSV